MVDADDYDWLNQRRWYASRRDFPYACRTENRKAILMHREIVRPPKELVVDHINGNGLNNRRCNLLVCTPTQNRANVRPRSGSSRFIGVYRRGDRWQAKIAYRGRYLYLGTFDDEVEAARADGDAAAPVRPDAIRAAPGETGCHKGGAEHAFVARSAPLQIRRNA
jgi:hypothetical protein